MEQCGDAVVGGVHGGPLSVVLSRVKECGTSTHMEMVSKLRAGEDVWAIFVSAVRAVLNVLVQGGRKRSPGLRPSLTQFR